jgi:hypothetical protein
VSQDENTGPDGWILGAKPIVLDQNEGAVRGTVTYPGGDRVDWKLVELPRGQTGVLDVDLHWRSPRPGLRIAVDAFDHDHLRVGDSTRVGRYRRHLQVAGARGRVYLRVYAVRRSDAGRYRLSVHFTPDPGPDDVSRIEIPLPPPLPDVPAEAWHCHAFEPDRPFDWCRPVPCSADERRHRDPAKAPCEPEPCPSPPDVEIAACRDTMACPSPPDRRVRACHREFPICPPPGSPPDPSAPSDCQPRPMPPVVGRILQVEPMGSDVVITIGVGSDQGITTHWRGTILRGDTDQPLAGGDVVLVRVSKRVSIAKVHATVDVVRANQRVQLREP